MAAILSVLILLTCLALILAILIQNPKGGGLATGFSTGAQVMGVRRTADFLEKATWTLVVLLFVFSIATASPSGREKSSTGPAETSSTKDKAADFDTKKPAPAVPNTGAPTTPGTTPTTPTPAK